MGKARKNQRLRDQMQAAAKHAKQTTLENLKDVPATSVEYCREKQIVISQIQWSTKEDELVLKVGFRLIPSKTFFSKVILTLHFDGEKLNPTYLRIPQGSLSTDEFELSPMLDMKGVAEGPHKICVEMYELLDSPEKLTLASKEVTVDYVPVRRQDSWIKVPILKKVVGSNLTVVSKSEKAMHQKIAEEMKRQLSTRRDKW